MPNVARWTPRPLNGLNWSVFVPILLVGITLANLSILKTGKAGTIRFSALDAICRALDCQLYDLITFNAAAPADQTGEQVA